MASAPSVEAQAQASLSRTDWDIADQELVLAVRVVRAFDTVVYRFQKNKLVLDTIALNQQTYNQGQDLVKAGKLRPADLIILRTEVADSRALLGQSRTALTVASSELRLRPGSGRRAEVRPARRPDRARRCRTGRPTRWRMRHGSAGRIDAPVRPPSRRPTPICGWSAQPLRQPDRRPHL